MRTPAPLAADRTSPPAEWGYPVACLVTATILALYLLRVTPGDLGPEWIDTFRLLVFLYEPSAALVGIGILLLAFFPAVRRTGSLVVGWVGAHPVPTSLGFLLLCIAGAIGAYRAYPLSPDEYVARFQAEVFAAGRVTGSMPVELLDWLVPRQGLFLPSSHATGEVISGYWPGHSALMAPFALLGVPWLLNPVLGAATVFLVHRLALTVYRDQWLAGLAAGLTIASPVVAVNAMSYYSMPAHLALNLLFSLLLIRPSRRSVLGAGLVGSAAVLLHNPVPHLLFAAPWVGWLLWRREHRGLVPWLAAGYLPALVLGLAWAGLQARVGAGGTEAAWGQGRDAGAYWLQRVSGVFRLPTGELLQARVLALLKVWLWAVPGLPLLAVLGARHARRDPIVGLMAASAVLTLLGYFFVGATQGYGWGYRYFHSAWGALPLVAVGVFAAWSPAAPPARRTRLSGYVAGSVVLSLVLATSQRFGQVSDFIGFRLSQMPSTSHGVPHVVLINTSHGYVTMDLVQNHPLLWRRPLYLRSMGPERDHAMLGRRFPSLSLLHADGRGEVWGLP